jgi:hypothetical protein
MTAEQFTPNIRLINPSLYDSKCAALQGPSTLCDVHFASNHSLDIPREVQLADSIGVQFIYRAAVPRRLAFTTTVLGRFLADIAEDKFSAIALVSQTLVHCPKFRHGAWQNLSNISAGLTISKEN